MDKYMLTLGVLVMLAIGGFVALAWNMRGAW
jgi:hypothetical protein